MKFSTSTTEKCFIFSLLSCSFYVMYLFQYILSWYASLLHALLSIKSVRRHHYRVNAAKDLKISLRALDGPWFFCRPLWPGSGWDWWSFPGPPPWRFSWWGPQWCTSHLPAHLSTQKHHNWLQVTEHVSKINKSEWNWISLFFLNWDKEKVWIAFTLISTDIESPSLVPWGHSPPVRGGGAIGILYPLWNVFSWVSKVPSPS